ncbi:MAG: response regulator [Spirochaetaceae bacterium]|nr:MAG: response regulator [Spirochaetaceae bacterium]
MPGPAGGQRACGAELEKVPFGDYASRMFIQRPNLLRHRVASLFLLGLGVLFGVVIPYRYAGAAALHPVWSARVPVEGAFAVLMVIPLIVVAAYPRVLPRLGSRALFLTNIGFGLLFAHAVTELFGTLYALGQHGFVGLISDLAKVIGTVFLVAAVSSWMSTLRRAGADARETARRLSIATGAAQLGIWQVDYSRGLLSGDDRMCALFGLPEGRFFTSLNDWLSALPDESSSVFQQALTEARTKGLSLDVEFDLRAGSGADVQVVRCVGQCRRDDEGRVSGVLGTCEDITARVHDRRARTLEESRFRGLFDLAPVGIAMNDFETGDFLEFNAALNEPAGYTPEEFRKLSYWDVTPRTYIEAERKQIELMDRKGYYGPFEKEYIRKDGSRYPVLLHGIKTKDPASGRDVIWSFIQDMSELKQAQSAVIESETRFHQIADTIPVVFWIRTPEQMLYINPAYETIWGRSRESLYENPFSFVEAIHIDDRGRVLEALQREFGDAVHFNEEYRIVRPDGEVRWVRASSNPVLDEHGHIIRSAGAALDITETRNAIEAAHEASRAKGQFIANMSHEIRTPLNVVTGLTTVLLDTALTAQQRDYLDTIEVSSRHLLGIISDILDYSKIEAGKLDLEVSTFLVSDLLEQLRVLFSQTAMDKGLELLFHVHSDVPASFEGDSLRIKQILINLLSNALKFTETGSVTLSMSTGQVTETDLTLCISVADTGIGMTEEQRQRLFGAFEQGDMSTTRRFGGTGLGLVITRSLVELMGGHIEVRSQSGKGSTFSLRIPMGLRPGLSIPDLCPDFGGNRVLVVDDNETARIILRDMLGACGVHIVEAESGSDALRVFRAADEQGSGFDFVILDWHMPQGLSGSETYRELRAVNADVPVLILGGPDQTHLQATSDEVLSAQNETFLAKPVTPASLKRAVNRALKRDGEPEPATPAARVPELTGRTILVVEDHEINREIIHRFLEPTGAHVILASNGREAIDRVSDNRIDLVLMDLQMPVLDGYGATVRIREDGFEGPVIALTAAATREDVAAVLREGMNGHLAKPLERDVLYRTLHGWLIEMSGSAARTSAGTPNPHPDRTPDQRDRRPGPNVLPSEMPGFDIQVGLRRCEGDEAFYAQQLIRFWNAIQEQYADLPDLLRTGDLTRARALAHSLKGTAGAVAAVRLHDLATRIGGLIADGVSIDALLCDELADAIDEAESHLRNSVLESAETVPVLPPDDVEADAVLTVRALREKLVHNEFVDEETIAGAMSYLSNSGDAGRIAELRQRIARFDLKGAMEVLDAIARDMGVTLE